MKTDSPTARERGPYHHGNLREELIRCGRQILQEQGINAFSLRSVTRLAGVSHGAPRNEFADKEGLLAAIAAEGFREMLDTRVRRLKPGMDARTRLTIVMDGYIDYATNQPALFQLMFGPQIGNRHRYPELLQRGYASYQLLHSTVRDYVTEAGYGDQFDDMLARCAWSAMHGISMLFSNRPDGPYTQDRMPLDKWRKGVIEFVLNSLLCEAKARAARQEPPSDAAPA